MAVYKLKDVCLKIGSGATPRGGKNAYCDKGISLIRSQNVLDFTFSYDGLAHINEQQAQKLSNVEVKAQDVLLNITGDSVARACKINVNVLPARVNQHVAIIRPDENKILSSYLLYFLQIIKPYLLQLASSGATRNALTKNMIENIEIKLPDIHVQQKIVSILDDIQMKINENNRINKNLQSQAQVIYDHLILEKADKTWSEGLLSDIATITMGQSPKGSSYNENGVGAVFFQGRAEFGFRFPIRKLYTTDPKRMAQANDVLMSVRAPVGDINVAYEDCCIGRGLSSIRSKDNHQSYVLYTMFNLRKQIDIFNGEGTVFGAINRDALNSMPISFPPLKVIDHFEALVSPMDAAILNNYKESVRLQTIRDSMLPMLMSGEIDVSNIAL